jgi:hypothetical protein
MISFHELRRRLAEPSASDPVDPVDVLGLIEELLALLEGGTFYIFRTDTNSVLARGIPNYESAKLRANQIRKSLGLKWDQVAFRMERKPATQFGVSRDGKTFTNASGQASRVQYARNYNPSKGRRFRGYTDAQGNYHDID